MKSRNKQFNYCHCLDVLLWNTAFHPFLAYRRLSMAVNIGGDGHSRSHQVPWYRHMPAYSRYCIQKSKKGYTSTCQLIS